MTDSPSPDSTTRLSPTDKTVFFGKGMIAVMVGIIALIILVIVFPGNGSSSDKGLSVAPDSCAQDTLSYVNANLVQPGTPASLVSVRESHGVYEITVLYMSRQSTLYATKDCSLLFMSPRDIQAAKASPVPAQAPVKSARPVVDLYVMAFCPFGTQAETVLYPVYSLLGTRADIRVRYITTVQGTTIDSVRSLHGITEAKEDAFQLCVRNSSPSSYWEYLRLFNEQCYPNWTDSETLASCRKNVTSTLNIDDSVIAACAGGSSAVAMLSTDERDSTANGATSSPTLVINGVEYRGARTPEAYKQAICNSFETIPAECNTVLSPVSATATGNC